MSTLVAQLQAAGGAKKGTNLGALLQWAATHVQSQDEALAELRESLQLLQKDYETALKGLQTARTHADELRGALNCVVTTITLGRDYAPHINVMAHHGVMPYAKNAKKPRGAAI